MYILRISDAVRRTKLCPKFTLEELGHTLLPRAGVVDSFVIKNAEGKVTDICSMYHLPSTVIDHPKHDKVNVSYCYYNVATTVSLPDLMKDLLIFARNRGSDVLNALDVMDNKEFLDKLKFGAGDGNLQYYVFNWKCPGIEPNEVGLVLL
jgi:glycylpeptide N-tetradecanoyltransferase